MTGNALTLTLVAIALSLNPAFAQQKSSPNCDYRRMDSIRVIHADVPLYPALAVQARISGLVDVRISVKGGAVISAESIPGANPMLSASAKENLQTWRFATQSNGDFCVRYMYELGNNLVPVLGNSTVEMRFPDFVRITADPLIYEPQSSGGIE